MNGAALDTLENSIGGTNPVQGSISPQNLDLVLVNNLPSTSSLSKVVSLSFEMLGWGGGGVTKCHSFLLSNPTLSLSSPLKTMLDAAANDLILNWNCFCSLNTKVVQTIKTICLRLWKVVAEYIDDMSNNNNGINDDINGDEDDDYADVCLEHRSQGGGGALMSSCPKLRRTFAQTCLRPANLQKLRANNQTIPLHRPAYQENLGKFFFCFSLQIMSLISTNNPTYAMII